MDKKTKAQLVILILLALFLRLYRLGEVPVGFHGDEASIGYNAYSLLKTAGDQNGNFLPLAIDQFGDFRPAGYHYLAIPFVAVFGLTEFATRLPSALIGALTIIPFYFVVLELFKRRSLALVSSLFLAISPWHVTLSRSTSESIIALFFVLWGVYFVQRRNLKYSLIAFILSFFFYHAARLFVPLLVLSFVFLARRHRSSTLFVVALIFSAALIFFASSGLGRAAQVSTFKAPGEMQELRQQVGEDGGLPPSIVRLLHNKGTFYLSTVLQNYFEHFAPKFLFLEGGQPVRYRVPWTGVMYEIDSVMVLIGFIGLVELITRKKERLYSLPIVWILLAPIPAALTFGELPGVQRAIFMLPALIILAGFGILFVLERAKKLFLPLLSLLILLYGYQGFLFLHNYFHHSFTHEPWYRNAAEKELVLEVDRYAKEGKKIVMTSQNDNNLIFYLFYLKFDPRQFQLMGSPRDKDNLVFENMTFMYKHCPLEGSDKDKALGKAGVIYVNLGACKIPFNSTLLKEITWPDNSIAFRLIELKE